MKWIITSVWISVRWILGEIQLKSLLCITMYTPSISVSRRKQPHEHFSPSKVDVCSVVVSCFLANTVIYSLHTVYEGFIIRNVLPVATVTGHCVQLSKHSPCPACPAGPFQAPKWTCPCWASWRCWKLWPGSPGRGRTSVRVAQSTLVSTKQKIIVFTSLTAHIMDS